MPAEYSRRIETRLSNAIRSCDPATLKVTVQHRGRRHQLMDIVVRWVRVRPASELGPMRRYPQWVKVGSAWTAPESYDRPLSEAEIVKRLAPRVREAVEYIERKGGAVANKTQLAKYLEVENAGTH